MIATSAVLTMVVSIVDKKRLRHKLSKCQIDVVQDTFSRRPYARVKVWSLQPLR